MITSRELTLMYNHQDASSKIKRASEIAGSLAEKLKDGQYLLRPQPQPAFFIRVDDWTTELDIEVIDLVNDYFVQLSNGRRIDFNQDLTDDVLVDSDRCRIVLLSDQGFSSYLINMTN